jgi:hypothetical protein
MLDHENSLQQEALGNQSTYDAPPRS